MPQIPRRLEGGNRVIRITLGWVIDRYFTPYSSVGNTFSEEYLLADHFLGGGVAEYRTTPPVPSTVPYSTVCRAIPNGLPHRTHTAYLAVYRTVPSPGP